MLQAATLKVYAEGEIGITNNNPNRNGAYSIGLNMFSPPRVPWEVESWKGWWGDNPLYRCPTFVNTHHPQPDIELSARKR